MLDIGALAQLGERKVRNLEVRGSIPLCSTNSVYPSTRFMGWGFIFGSSRKFVGSWTNKY